MIRRMIAAITLLTLSGLASAAVDTREIYPHGKLGLVDGKYVFTTFSATPEQDEGWVNLATGKPVWQTHSRTCHQRVIGRGDCPGEDPLGIRTVTVNKGGVIFKGLFTAGLQPLLGKNTSTIRYDRSSLDRAIAEAAKNLERDGESLRSLQARFLEQSERLARQSHRFEQTVIEASHAISVSSDIEAEFAKKYPLALIRKDIRYRWEEQGSLENDNLPGLIATLEALVTELETGPAGSIGSLALSCPDTIFAKSMQCDDLQAIWEGDQLTLSGNISVKEWHLPATALHFDLANDLFSVQFSNGLMRLTNLGNETLTLTLVSPFDRNGVALQRLLQMNRFASGKSMIYPSPLTSGDMDMLNEKTIRITSKNLDTEVFYGARINYRIGKRLQQTTSDLKQSTTVAELMKMNLAFASAKGHGIQDTTWMKEKVGGSAYHQGNLAIADHLLGPIPLRRRF